VEVAGNTGNGYGNPCVINHGYDMARYTAYVQGKSAVGQRVKRGEVIGYVGSTGKTLAPIATTRYIVTGIPWIRSIISTTDITPEQYDRLLKLAASSNQSFD